ncbi:single stranded-binding protein c31A [Brevipalpus obovatus]|uniref:single stranded-binding protein c31A n=1 Tax=Brevipalpus obovatus TaxID=246614 RepID=UPI003D9F719C
MPKYSSKKGGSRSSGAGSSSLGGESKDVKFKLSNNRFISVGAFKNKVRVDIREYYLDDKGEKKPGKKGISLSMEEWEKLKDLISDIDKAAGKSDSESAKGSEEESE